MTSRIVPLLAHRLSRFTVISGIGWTLDFTVTLCAVWAGAAVMTANGIGALCGVSFVFFAAQRQVFRRMRGGQLRLLASYLCYQAVAILAASWLIGVAADALMPAAAALSSLAGDWLAPDLLPPTRVSAAAVAKALVTPLTLYSNFLFMGWLLEGKVSLR